MKKIFLLTILTFFISFSMCVTGKSSSIFCEFSSNKKISRMVELHDFSGNDFILYELDGGYAIYSVESKEEVFIEGSLDSNSPYYSYLDQNQLFYLGPGNYYYQVENRLVNIRSNEIFDFDDINFSYELYPNISTFSGENLVPDPNETETDLNDFTIIKYGEYFKKLKEFPYNYFGDCGLVALSILLGYLDTFYNDDFLPNDLTTEAKYYKDNNGKWELDYIREEHLVSKVREKYTDASVYDFKDWNQVPGTTQGLKDYLFNNYLHTFFIKDNEKGYPMLNGELKDTMKDYMKDNCPQLLNSIQVSCDQIINTHINPQKLIAKGVPVILVLKDFSDESGNTNKKGHDVVAYGYKDDKFLVHSGWSGTNTMILNKSTIYGYYALEYTGEHVHSKNVNMVSGHTMRHICGCGYIQNELFHTYYYENVNFKKHRVACSCGLEYEEDHSFYTINEGVMNYSTIFICSKCGYRKNF